MARLLSRTSHGYGDSRDPTGPPRGKRPRARPEGSVDVRCLLAGQFLLDNPASRPGKAPFHLLLEGRCAVEYRGRTIQLCAGDVVLFPHGGAHRVLVEHGAEPVDAGEKPG